MKITINQSACTRTSIEFGDLNNNISSLFLADTGVRKERRKLTIGGKSYGIQIEYDEEPDRETNADDTLEKIVRDVMRSSVNGHAPTYKVIIHRSGCCSETYLVTESGIGIASMEQKQEMMNSGIVPGINVVVVVSPPMTCFGGIVASGMRVQAHSQMITPCGKNVRTWQVYHRWEELWDRGSIRRQSTAWPNGTPWESRQERDTRPRWTLYAKYRMIVGFLGSEGKPNPTICFVTESLNGEAPANEKMAWLNSGVVSGITILVVNASL